MENLRIEAYSFIDYNIALIQAVKDGWHLGELTNENYPQKFGDHYYTILERNPNFEHKECEACKDKAKAVVEQSVVSPEVESEVEPVVKTTKKTKKV